MRRLLPIFAFALAAIPGAFAQPTDDSLAWTDPLRTTDAIHARFTEERHLAIRREPLELTGELRFQSGVGLSLHYLTPDERTVIVDQRGVALRDARGRTKRAPARSEAAASAQVLLHMLTFDWAGLGQDFVITGEAPDATGNWTVHFKPTAEAAQKGLHAVVVRGQEQAITHLTLGPEEPDQIDIVIDPAERSPAFTTEERATYFR